MHPHSETFGYAYVSRYSGAAVLDTDQSWNTVQRRYCDIGVARGCSGCTCTPRAEKKLWGRNLLGKVVNAPPCRAGSQILEHISGGWGRFGA